MPNSLSGVRSTTGNRLVSGGETIKGYNFVPGQTKKVNYVASQLLCQEVIERQYMYMVNTNTNGKHQITDGKGNCCDCMNGSNVVSKSDFNPVELILNNAKSRPSTRIERQNLHLQEYHFSTEHTKNQDNPSDFMS